MHIRVAAALGGVVAVAIAAVRASAALDAAQPPPPSYRIEPVDPATLSKAYSPAQIALLEKLNRRDVEHLIRLKEMIVPVEWSDDELAYAPLPATWGWAADQPKALVVHQPAQVFGAYESGRLVRWGPVSSGRKETPTPPGLYALTWRSKSRVSTDNAQWLLKWYFNFVNERGISFHQFELPGAPASHACVRLLERDAMWLYDWGAQWTLSADRRTVVTAGTPVLVLGVYDFNRPAPWLALDWWAAPVTLPEQPSR